MTYGDFNDLNRSTVSDKILLDKACNIAKNSKFLSTWNFLIKKLLVVVLKIRVCLIKN